MNDGESKKNKIKFKSTWNKKNEGKYILLNNWKLCDVNTAG